MTHPGALLLRGAGITCVALAVAMSAFGLIVYVSGYEVAFILLIVGLAGFVLGIGLLAAARRFA
jgi:hypothetical protein